MEDLVIRGRKRKSLYQWCIENDRQDVLDRWDYELNNKKPNEISFGTATKYWFKCLEHPEHKSELKSPHAFTSGQEGSMKCNQCNSIAQYILDNFPDKDLYDVWDKEKNEDIDPWSIDRGSSCKKYWFICQEKDYHGSYGMTCCNFIAGHRCPYCSTINGRVHPKDSFGQNIIDNYGAEFLWSMWSDKNKKSPFEYAINSHETITLKYIDSIDECYETTCNNFMNSKTKRKKQNKKRENNITTEKIKKTFYDWCIEHNRQDILDRWDYELNGCSPKDIGYGTGKKYWFKCLEHSEHHSELKNINAFTSSNGDKKGTMECKQCNSIAQYILDNFSDKKIEEVWDFEKNTINPWDISCGSRKKVWIKCQEKDYHGSYELICKDFSNGTRCSYCGNYKVHPKDSLGQYIIDNYGEEFLWTIWSDKNKKTPFEYSSKSGKKVWWKCQDKKHEDYLRACRCSMQYEFRCPECVKEMNNSMIEGKTKSYLEELGYEVFTEHKCTIRPINPKTKHYLPYDNEIILENGKHLIIEVHGEQHYNNNFYKAINKCTEEEANIIFHQRQLYDRYKRIKCKQAGYEYLEIPYTAFDKKETYKQMINNKIKNILKEEK